MNELIILTMKESSVILGLFFYFEFLEVAALLKITLIIIVILSIALLLFLFYQSQKLLRHTQKQAMQERRDLKGNYQIHPKLEVEWKKLDEMKENLNKKNDQSNNN